jgi:multidrug efflux pump subunit AcrB
LLLLGSFRSTFIVVTSIPLSILTSLICLQLTGQTINTMTLGGFALAVGMLVDDATVEVENIHRNMAMGKGIVQAILDGAEQIAVPTFVSTLSICIVFVPVILLSEPARSLFVPLGMAVVFAMMASYLLSRTIVPVMAQALLRHEHHGQAESGSTSSKRSLFSAIHLFVEGGFEKLRGSYRELLAYALEHRVKCLIAFCAFYLSAAALVPFIGQDFFPQVDSGQLRLHVTVPTGTRIEETERIFLKIESAIRELIPHQDLKAILDNIGLPTSGINLAYGDNLTISNFDGEILVSLSPEHKESSAHYARALRTMFKERFPECGLFFQPADIVSQILNAGLPAPIDVQVTGKKKQVNYEIAKAVKERLEKIPGAVDVTLHQITDSPQLKLDVDRARATELGLSERDVASSLLINLSSSFQVAPTFWVNPQNGVNYNVAVQTPTHRLASVEDLMRTELSGANPAPGTSTQMLSNLAKLSRGSTPAVVNHYRIQPVYDIYVNVQDRDLGGVVSDIKKVLQEFEPQLPKGSYFVVRGQAEAMNSAFTGLLGGIAFALILVYLLLVINFHSWIDPVIILMAIPGAFAGIVWGLFATATTLSVPALMGAMMSIGVASANSILMITFANDELEAGRSAGESALNAGYTRFRPVLMTALAMVIGTLPMALGLGEGGSQNAPLGRAVIGGLLSATLSTLFFVPVIFSLVRARTKPGHGHGGHPQDDNGPDFNSPGPARQEDDKEDSAAHNLALRQ